MEILCKKLPVGFAEVKTGCIFASASEKLPTAGMAELVDAYVSGAYARKGVGVRLPLPAPYF